MQKNTKTKVNPARVNFQPLGDRILLTRLDEEETIRGGLVIPDTAKEKPQEGMVVAIGEGRTNDRGETFPLHVQPGQKVLFGKYAGVEIKIDGELFLILREEEILGKRR